MAVELLQTVIQWLLNVWELALVCALQSTLSGLKSTVGLYKGSGPHSGKYTWPWLHDYKVHETQSQNEWAINADQKYKDSYPLTLWTSPYNLGSSSSMFLVFQTAAARLPSDLTEGQQVFQPSCTSWGHFYRVFEGLCEYAPQQITHQIKPHPLPPGDPLKTKGDRALKESDGPHEGHVWGFNCEGYLPQMIFFLNIYFIVFIIIFWRCLKMFLLCRTFF